MTGARPPHTQPLSGARLLLEALTRDATRPVFDATDRIPNAIPTANNATALAAATGFAAASGRAGVAVVSAPDTLPTGIPVVMVVIAEEAVAVEGMRWSAVVSQVEQLPRTIQQAVRNTLASAPGPVLVQVHPEVLAQTAVPEWSDPPQYPALEGDPENIEAAAAALSVCQTPVLILGQQWRFSAHAEALRAFVVRMELPCFALGCAAGSLPADSRFAIQAGLPAALAAADLVLTVGVPGTAPLLTDVPPLAFLVQIDLDPAGHSPSADVAIRADAGRVMAQLTGYREDDGWLLQVRAFEQAGWEALSPAEQAMRDALAEAPVVVAETAHSTLPPSEAQGRHLLAQPGVGAGVVIGAGRAWPAHPVALISGDPVVVRVFPPVKEGGL
ncbi:MAG: thiamine pyrophosphate-dependent acetolactate synthase large subunit-like protein [Myxococcota bacterium]|jgi:thiamine pyrophosphate-dependent acetolactate synthase large subunit-like protein